MAPLLCVCVGGGWNDSWGGGSAGRRGGEFEAVVEPGAGEAEFAVDGGFGDGGDLGGFRGGEAEHVAELDEAAFAGVEGFQLFEGTVEVDHVFAGGVDPGQFVVEGEADGGAAFGGAFAAGVIDEDPAHEAGGEAEEVAAVFEAEFALFEEAEVELVDESGGLHEAAGAFAAAERGGYVAEAGVDLFEEGREGGLVAGFPLAEQDRDVARVWLSLTSHGFSIAGEWRGCGELGKGKGGTEGLQRGFGCE